MPTPLGDLRFIENNSHSRSASARASPGHQALLHIEPPEMVLAIGRLVAMTPRPGREQILMDVELDRGSRHARATMSHANLLDPANAPTKVDWVRVIRFGLLASVISAPRGWVLSALTFSIRARRRGSRTRIPFAYRWEDASCARLRKSGHNWGSCRSNSRTRREY